MGSFQLLSMGWIYAAPAILGALVILYFLKLKRTEITISSSYLWKSALDDLRVNSPLQRLRMNLLLILQALALAALILALARPVSQLGGLTGSDSILLIDISASMQTKDGGGGRTRFERARDEALRLVDDLSRGDRAIVIAFCDETRVLTSMTESKAELRDALNGLRVTDRPTRLAPALQRVHALVADQPERNPVLYVLTDGRVERLGDVGLGDVPLHYVRLGTQRDNVGIIGIDVRPASGLDEFTRIFVSVANTGEAAVEVGVDFHVDGKLLGSRTAKIGKGGVASVPYEAVLAEAGQLEVRLDPGDDFARDDVAYALLRPQEQVRLLLVTPGNLFLDSALREDPVVWKTPTGEIPVMLPEAFDPKDPALLSHDLIVLDRARPKELPPGNYLTFDSLPPFPGLTDQGNAQDWRVLDWDESHEVARFVNFGTLVLPEAQKFGVRPADTVIVRADKGPILFEARDGDRRALVVNFDLMRLPIEGAWTFDPSYPIFLANAVRWLGGSGRDKKDLLVRTGGTAELRFPSNAVKATVDPPGALEPYDVAIRPGDDVLRVTDLDAAGVYSVAFKAEGNDTPVRTTLFAANTCDQGESQIAPADAIELTESGKAVAEDTILEQNRDVWKVFAILALVVVMLEWWIYNRRVFI